MSRVYLSLGSNIGDRADYLNKGIKKIDEIENCEVVKISKFYETLPWGYENQDTFVNACIEISTSLRPHELLKKLQEIEINLHRVRDIRWGPRTLDIDILLFDDIIVEDEKLIIPHPRIKERAFVLVPLYEINPEGFIKGEKIKDILGNLDTQGIKEYEV